MEDDGPARAVPDDTHGTIFLNDHSRTGLPLGLEVTGAFRESTGVFAPRAAPAAG